MVKETNVRWLRSKRGCEPWRRREKKKNNHFVPRNYLRRFCSRSEREIGLYNLKSDRIIISAPIKSQCSRDYFYSKNPKFEEFFGVFEGHQRQLLDAIIGSERIPAAGSEERISLYNGIMFQVGRTASTVANMDYVTEQFGKAILKHHLERKGERELLEHLPKLRISTTPKALIDTIRQHLAMRPLIDDLECALFFNETTEDFLTSDHPVALCNSLPESRGYERRIGFASRGLIILYPISPRALLFLSDAEAYKVEKSGEGICTLRRPQDVIELNLAQCESAYENLYFASAERVQATLEAFRRHSDTVRPSRSTLMEIPIRRGVLFNMPREVRRLPLPRAVQLRHAVKTRKYKDGNIFVRDTWRAAQAHVRS